MAVKQPIAPRQPLIAGLALLLMLSTSAFAQKPTLNVEDGKVWVKNLNAEVLYTFTRYFKSQHDWQKVFPVTVKNHETTILLQGRYDFFSEQVSFTPRFPFLPGTEYAANFFTGELAHNANEIYLPAMDDQTLTLDFRVTTQTTKPAEVEAIYPTSDTLPENLLKFHIVFTKPMTSGEVYSRVKLINAAGQVVDKPFLIVDQELWDPEMKTVTLLFDPGRVKRGLRPNREMKPALQETQSYTLVVTGGWPDIDGIATTESFVKKFYCAKADRSILAMRDIVVRAPGSEVDPLLIGFGEPLDFIMLSNSIQVRDSKGGLVNGSINICPGACCIQFRPKAPWSDSSYSVLLNPLTEDLAGNNFKRPFDHDLYTDLPELPEVLQLNFTLTRHAN